LAAAIVAVPTDTTAAHAYAGQDHDRALRVLNRHLLTPVGLHTLSPGHPA